MKLIKKVFKYLTKFNSKQVANSNAEMDGFLDEYDGESITGWCKSLINESNDLLLSINGSECFVYANKYRSDLKLSGLGHCAFDFKYSLINMIKDKKWPVCIEVKHKLTGKHLNNSPLLIDEPKLIFEVMKLDEGGLKGWIKNTNNNSHKISLNLYINNQIVDQIKADHPVNINGCIGLHGFEIDRAVYGLSKSDKIMLTDAYGLGINISGNQKNESEIKTVTEQYDFKRHLNNKSTESQQNLRLKNVCKGVSVVIPVYAGIQETKACIESVLNSKNKIDIDLIVIDDCGPDDEIREIVAALQKTHQFTYIQNQENLGFVRTANKGMQLASSNDVVLLNSDTIVADGWIDALNEAAYAQPNIGTVTPLSNNASICSFPNMGGFNDFPSNLNDLNNINNACKDLPSELVDLPTAHGFCMYIKRELINEIGGFDHELWGKGYGEENDFSLRAIEKGYRNVATSKTFVYHHGSVSFSDSAETLMSQSLEKLNKLYPKYDSLVSEFIKHDQMSLLRNELSIKLIQKEYLKKQYVQTVLLVSHDFGGGTKKATDDITRLLLSKNIAVFMLHKISLNTWKLIFTNSGMSLVFTENDAYQAIVKSLKEFSITSIHYHHIAQFDKSVMQLPIDLGVSYTVTIHDYYVICPRLTLLDSAGKYCNEPKSSICNQCIKLNGINDSIRQHPLTFESNIKVWRAKFEGWLNNADAVTAPNIDVITRIKKYFPNIKSLVLPNIDKDLSVVTSSIDSCGDVVKIGVVGAIGTHKGFERLMAVADYIEKYQPPVLIKVVGYTKDDNYFYGNNAVTITGEYKPSDLPNYLADVDLVLFPGECPETYSYALTEVLEQGKRIIAFDIGAISTRLKELKWGKLIPLDTSVEELLQIASDYSKENMKSHHIKIESSQYKEQIINTYTKVSSEKREVETNNEN